MPLLTLGAIVFRDVFAVCTALPASRNCEGWQDGNILLYLTVFAALVFSRRLAGRASTTHEVVEKLKLAGFTAAAALR